jgi:membrane-bound ClpP family serine protease
MTLLTLAQAAATDAAGKDEMYLVWGFVLLGAAVGLLFLELLVPSGGLIGILCGVAVVASVVAFFQYDTVWGMGMALTYVILAPIVLIFGFRIWLSSPLARRMILGADQSTTTADTEETVLASEQARLKRLAELRELIGAEGVTETALRPVGTVRINGQRVDGMAESGVIEANTPVVVTDVYDNQIKVRAL